MDIHALNDLLHKEVDRKEFLKYVGIFMLALCGISAIGKTVTTLSKSKPTKGFGAGKYGV